jgi:hypothetical protein
VREKIDAGKKLTASALLIKDGMDLFTLKRNKTKKVQLAEIDDAISSRKDHLVRLRQTLQRTKFAILLASKWFDEFETMEDCTLDIDDNQFTLGVREVKVNI